MAVRRSAERRRKRRPVIGWREWLDLPDLGIHRIKVKVDTGARTSSLHAFDLERFAVEGESWVRFRVHPMQKDSATTVVVESPLLGERRVRPSTGRAAARPVIRTRAVLGAACWPIEITLINRDVMGFRMLLGRQAVRRRFLVDPGRSFLAGEPAVS